MSAMCGKPKDLRANPPDPKDQGRSVCTGIAEDVPFHARSRQTPFGVDQALVWARDNPQYPSEFARSAMSIDHPAALNTFRTGLRNTMRAKRAALTAPQRIAAAGDLVTVLEQLPEILVDQSVAGYWAVGGELPLHIAVARLRARGQGYLLPVIAADQRLRFAPLRPDSKLQPNRHGIVEPECGADELLEPSAIEVVLVPLVAFNRNGTRLGMGAGYYDRSFAFLADKPRPASPLLVGIGYSFQEVTELAAQSWDIAMDYVATDKELINCNPLLDCNLD